MRTTSTGISYCSSVEISLCRCSLLIFVSSCMPEPAGIICIPLGPSRIISFRLFIPFKTCLILYLCLIPKSTSILHNPRSASKISTFLLIPAKYMARLATQLVLPTPPFPLDTAIIRGLLRNFIPFLPLLHVFKAVPLP